MLPLILIAGLALAGPVSGAPVERSQDLCEYGMTCGMLGRLDQAEQAFTALLSRTPGDARALNGLGNVALLRLDPPLAERCYAAAERLDPGDAGLVLNRAVALLLGGDTLAAQAEAAHGIEMAGGAGSAGEILGLTGPAAPAAARGAQGHPISVQELRQFLDRVGRRVKALLAGPPGASATAHADSVGAHATAGSAPDSLRVSPGKPLSVPRLRTAGPRSGRPDARDLVDILYWKP